MIGHAYVNHTVWEIWSDGHAYSDPPDYDHWQRHESGHWMPHDDLKRVSKRHRHFSIKDWIIYSEVSEALEKVYLNYLNKLISGEHEDDSS